MITMTLKLISPKRSRRTNALARLNKNNVPSTGAAIYFLYSARLCLSTGLSQLLFEYNYSGPIVFVRFETTAFIFFKLLFMASNILFRLQLPIEIKILFLRK